jgi:guanine nucleotide-binding protein G(i) subunit alpha
MGNCTAKAPPTKEQRKQMRDEYIRSKQIETQNMKDLEHDARVCKLLLLGAGESGKSTLFKQITTIYGEGFSQKQLDQYAPSIHQNAISSMRQLVEYSDLLEEKFDTRTRVENKASKDYFNTLAADQSLLTPEIGQHIAALWSDQGIQNTYLQRAKFQFMDAANYFFENISRISQDNYQPTYEDVLRCRVRTTGIVETKFELANHKFLLIDVGGQRNERKKWIHSFDGVTAVIFVSSMSEYDQLLFEDNSTNRVVESLNLFEEICTSRWFVHSPVILFMNKRDLFELKLKKTPMKDFFNDYEGGEEYEKGVEYLKGRFMAKAPQKKQGQIYIHVTCATDKDNVAHVFNDVKDIFIRQNLQQSGLEL